jgi:N6-adenosine-specific RNA methylase IME4
LKYNIIYIDPPWHYNCFDKSEAAHGAATSHYSTMTIQELSSLPISDLADKNCALFLWVTDPCLPEGLQCLNAWGFKFVTIAFYWVKLNKTGTPFLGLGHYTRGNPEICLLGLKGRLPRQAKNIPKLIISERREHSRKPDEARDRIVSLFGDIPRIELFARTLTPGWDATGYDIDGLDIRESIADRTNKIA